MYFRILTLAGLMLMACSSLRSHSASEPRVHRSESKPASMSMEARREIVDYASGLVGTRYAYGGCKPAEGFDCSGFTSYVLSRFGMSLPRTSTGQSALGKAITFDNVKPGDLVFFGKGKRIEHVGIVVKSSRRSVTMVHSSSSHGVRVEDVYRSDYWKRRIMFGVDLDSL